MNPSTKLFVNNLNVVMKEHKINRVQLSKELGIPYTTLCDWCTGRIMPKYEKIQLIAEYFDINVSELFGDKMLTDPDDDCSNEIFEVMVAREIPFDMTPAVAMKKYKYFPDCLDGNKINPKNSYFGLKLNDDSMQPFMSINDYGIFVESNKLEADGLYCIKEKNMPATIRKIVLLKGGFLVIPVNQDSKFKTESYKNEELNDKIFILGKCIKYSHMVDYENEN